MKFAELKQNHQTHKYFETTNKVCGLISALAMKKQNSILQLMNMVCLNFAFSLFYRYMYTYVSVFVKIFILYCIPMIYISHIFICKKQNVCNVINIPKKLKI